MNKTNKKMDSSCLVFLSFSAAFLILSIVNIFLPISNFKMTILSVVSLLLSFHQLFEVQEEVKVKIAEIEEKTTQQRNHLYTMVNIPEQSEKQPIKEVRRHFKSQWFFVVAMIILIVGLVLDFDYSDNGLTNTITIVTFSVIFFTMAYKERFIARLDMLNRELYDIDQRIIAQQCKVVNEVKDHVQLQIPTL